MNGRNCDRPIKPRSSGSEVMSYTCQPTATVCICTASVPNVRAIKYRMNACSLARLRRDAAGDGKLVVTRADCNRV